MNIQQLIYSEFFDYSNARKPKNTGLNSKKPVLYSEIEVSQLIDSIVISVNRELAILYFKEKEK